MVAVLKRLLFAVLLIFAVAVIVRIDHDGYHDANDDGISTLDAVYYATVSVTTTGYGDIVPTTKTARLLSTSIVTLARIVFLILLVGTTFEVATRHGRNALIQRQWRKQLRDHIIICGYGTKGRSAAMTLRANNFNHKRIVIIDNNRERVEEAATHGLAGIVGDATRSEVLQLADVHEARSVIIAPDNDAASVLMTLNVRELNPNTLIVAAVREETNAHLLRQSGADSVTVSSETSGRLLGISTYAPEIVQMFEDMLAPSDGLDLIHRFPTSDEIGSAAVVGKGQVLLAIKRESTFHLAGSRETMNLQNNDVLLLLVETQS